LDLEKHTQLIFNRCAEFHARLGYDGAHGWALSTYSAVDPAHGAVTIDPTSFLEGVICMRGNLHKDKLLYWSSADRGRIVVEQKRPF